MNRRAEQPSPTADTPVTATPVPPAAPWYRVLLVPWWALFRPRAAVTCMLGASGWAVAATAVLTAFTIGAIWVFLVLWDSTRVYVYVPPPTMPTATGPAASRLAAMGYVGYGGSSRVVHRTLGEVWANWHQGILGPAEAIFFGVVLGIVLLGLWLTWTTLPLLHRHGRVTPSISRAFRAILPVFGPGAELTLLLGVLAVAEDLELAGNGTLLGWLLLILPNAEMLTGWLAVVLVCALLLWLGAAVRAARRFVPAVNLPPVCEGCGYDLTHVSDAGLCSECGRPARDSLEPESIRPGSAWERHPTLGSFITSTARLWVRPTRFYRTLQLRTPPRLPTVFAFWHYLLIGLGAGAWIAAIALYWLLNENLYFGPNFEEAVYIASIVVFVAPAIWWAGLRTVGAIAATVWLILRYFADHRYAAKVISYEAGFAWVYYVWVAVVAGSFFLFDDWITDLIGRDLARQLIGGGSIEFIVFVAGLLGITICLLLRFRLAGRAIRWANC